MLCFLRGCRILKSRPGGLRPKENHEENEYCQGEADYWYFDMFKNAKNVSVFAINKNYYKNKKVNIDKNIFSFDVNIKSKLFCLWIKSL